MAHVPAELMHEKQIKVRLANKDHAEWVKISHETGHLHSVLARMTLQAILEEYRETGKLPEFITRRRA